MKIQLNHKDNKYSVDLSKPIDISIPLIPGQVGPNCFWAPVFDAQPVQSGDWIGDVNQGGGVNFKNVQINPHGNGTHTECVGHISSEKVSINSVLNNFHHIARVISIYPQKLDNNDRVITRQQVQEALEGEFTEAVIVRTLPNSDDKMNRVYSGTNPPYVDHQALQYLVDNGVKHFLIDLPSVDREQDDGKLLGHKAFWNYPAVLDTEKTISEMVYIDNVVPDGLYLLNLQIASFDLDASPSKPVIYTMEKSDS